MSAHSDLFNIVASLVRKHNIDLVKLQSAVKEEKFNISSFQQALSQVVEDQILTGEISIESQETLDIDFLNYVDEDDSADSYFGDDNQDWEEDEPPSKKYRYNDFVSVEVSF